MNKERLTGCGVLREGVTYGLGREYRSHSALRQVLGDEDIYNAKPRDVDGFVTDKGRFLSRVDAISVAINAGQLSIMWRGVRRPLLSSDLNWNGGKTSGVTKALNHKKRVKL